MKNVHFVNEFCLAFIMIVSVAFLLWAIDCRCKRLLGMILALNNRFNCMAYKQALHIVYTMSELIKDRELTDAEQEIWHSSRALILEYENQEKMNKNN